MSELMIPIKYKKRMFHRHREIWHELLDVVAPSSDLGRGQTTSSMIPNLGQNRIREFLLQRYKKNFCVFTNCASDGLDLVVRAVAAPVWYVPSYTWVSPVNAIAKSGAEIRFLDVDPSNRMIDYRGYDPDHPLVVPHVDGRVAPAPPARRSFVLEDAAQSPLAEGIGFGDATVLSFGSSKRLGLLGQGGCVLTNNESLANRLQRLTVFGLDGQRELIEPGDKSFFDPFNALCTLQIYELCEASATKARMDRIIAFYNEALGIENPNGLERYSFKVRERDEFRRHMAESGVETRVWFEGHCALWPCYRRFVSADLPVSDFVARTSVDVPLNEYLEDHEVESVARALKNLKEYVIREEMLLSPSRRIPYD